MEITGKIIAVLPAQGGVSQRTGNQWKSQDYVIETHDQYPKKCCFRVFGEEKINQFNIQLGEEMTVSFLHHLLARCTKHLQHMVV